MSDPMTVAEAAVLLKCSPRTVQRLINANKLKPVRKLAGPNGAYLLARGDVLQRLIEQQKKEAAA